MSNISLHSQLNNLKLEDIVIVIVSYDISDDKKRRQVVKILEQFGERVQYSVFECILHKAKLGSLKRILRDIDLEEGESIIIYTIKTAKYMEKWRRLQNDKFRKAEIL